MARELTMTDLKRGSVTRLTLDMVEYNLPLKGGRLHVTGDPQAIARDAGVANRDVREVWRELRSAAASIADAPRAWAADSTRRRAEEVVQLPRTAERGRHRPEVLQDDPVRMVQRELAAVFGGRQLQRQSVRRQHEEVEHAHTGARRMPARFGPPMRTDAHFWRRFLKPRFTKA